MNLKGKKILIVEDTILNQMLIKAQLKSLDLDITVVENGSLAVEEVKKKKFDIILMDIQMPIMNGFDATKTIRSMNIQTPIIAITATDMPKEEYLSVGMNDCLIKPIELNKFLNLIYRYIK